MMHKLDIKLFTNIISHLVLSFCKYELNDIIVAPIAGFAKNSFIFIVKFSRIKSNIVATVLAAPPSCKCPRYFYDITLSIPIVFPHGKKFHQLSGIVFIGFTDLIEITIEVYQHSRIFAHI